MIARVSSTSILSLRSVSHTFHARRAIGIAFHSISGMLIAAMTGLALNAIISDRVGSASGDRFEMAGGGGFAPACGASVFAPARKVPISARLVLLKRSSSANSSGSWAGSYSSTRLAQS